MDIIVVPDVPHQNGEQFTFNIINIVVKPAISHNPDIIRDIRSDAFHGIHGIRSDILHGIYGIRITVLHGISGIRITALHGIKDHYAIFILQGSCINFLFLRIPLRILDSVAGYCYYGAISIVRTLPVPFSVNQSACSQSPKRYPVLELLDFSGFDIIIEILYTSYRTVDCFHPRRLSIQVVGSVHNSVYEKK